MRPDHAAALCVAAEAATPEVIRYLCEKGANVEAAPYDYTPLQLAAMANEVDRIKVLIAAGAKVGGQHELGSTALHLITTLKGTDKTVETTRFLVREAGACIDAQDEAGRTPLHIAASLQGDLSNVKNLINLGANVRIKDNRGETPRDTAQRYGSMHIVQMLNDAGG